MYYASRNQTHYACNAHKVCRMGNCKAMSPNIHSAIQFTMLAEHPKRIAKVISRQTCIANQTRYACTETKCRAHCNTASSSL